MKNLRYYVNRHWSEYPLGTKAHALTGGYWYKTERGWKWNGPGGSGGTFPRPGGDAIGACMEIPKIEPTNPSTK